MQVIPALDIKGGRVVRYAEDGPDMVYALDPVGTAQAFLAAGAEWLHVVDLDRAFDTGRDNDTRVGRITRLPGARVQMGGRLRKPDQVAQALDLGVARAVVATDAAVDPGVWESIARAVDPSRLAVAVDVRGGRLAQRGSTQPLSLGPDALVRRAVAAGGIGSTAHLLEARNAGLSGVIVGRALHEGRLTLREALACLA